jgi:hypothetical protein
LATSPQNQPHSQEEIEGVSQDFRFAIYEDNFDELKKLFYDYSFLRNDHFPRGDSVLCCAIGRQRLEMVSWLLDNGFDANPTGCTTVPLEYAIDQGNQRIVEVLLTHGADPNYGRPMIAALNCKDNNLALEFAKQLVQHGCEINAVYDLYGDMDKGFTALDFAESRPALAEFIRSQGGLTAKEVRSGSVSPRKEKATEPKQGVSLNSSDEVIAHFERTIGPASKKSLIQIVPTGIPIGIHTIAPAGNRKHMTLFTNGLSSEPMKVPEGAQDYRFAEIYIDLPGDWKVREIKEIQWAWPLHWLRKMAQYPHNNGTWLGAPVTLIADEDPPKPFYKGCPFSALFLFADSSFKRSDGNTVQLYRMIPLYASERAYELKHGLKKFMQAMDKHEVPTIIDMNRKPFA